MNPEQRKALLDDADARISNALAALKAEAGDTSTDVRSRVSAKELELRGAVDAANKRRSLIFEGINPD